MVFDARHLFIGDPEEEGPGPGPGHEKPAAEEPHSDLEALVAAAAGDGDLGERMGAVARLRVLVPTPEGVERLCRIVEDPADLRRLVAIQVLGFHRHWLLNRSSVQRVLGWARAETDPAAAASLVWVLRHRDVVQEFLRHPAASVVREAALGLPVNPETLEALLEALLAGAGSEAGRVLAAKLTGMHPNLAPRLVDHLLRVSASIDDQALGEVLSRLPQPSLFDLLVDRRGPTAWTMDAKLGESRGNQEARRISRLAAKLLQERPGADLIRMLVNRSVADEAYGRRHAAFLEKVMHNTREKIGAAFLDDLERLTVGASEDRVELMAKLLMSLGDKISGEDSRSQASDLIEKWKGMSPALKLKIFHLQQGLT